MCVCVCVCEDRSPSTLELALAWSGSRAQVSTLRRNQANSLDNTFHNIRHKPLFITVQTNKHDEINDPIQQQQQQ